MKILMVCLGNICRSPLAHGLLEKKIKENNLDWIVDSAGTSNYHEGKLPDRRSIEIANQHNLDITNQHSRPLLEEDLKIFDIIYAMDAVNYQNILELAKNEEEQKKIKLILNETHPTENRQVPDPYYGGDDGFLNVYNMLDVATDKIINRLA